MNINVFKQIPFRPQVASYALVATAMFAALSLAYFFYQYSGQAEQVMADKSRFAAQILAVNVSAGVVFDDTATVVKVLESVRQDESSRPSMSSTPQRS